MGCKNTLLPPPHFIIAEYWTKGNLFSFPLCSCQNNTNSRKNTFSENKYIHLQLYSFSKGTLLVWPAQPAVSLLSLLFPYAASIQLQFANLMSGSIPVGSDEHQCLALGQGTGSSCPMDETFPTHFPTLPVPALFRLGTLGASLAVSVHS